MLSDKEGRNFFLLAQRLPSIRPLQRLHKMTALAPSFGAVDVEKSAGEAVRGRVEGDQLNVAN